MMLRISLLVLMCLGLSASASAIDTENAFNLSDAQPLMYGILTGTGSATESDPTGDTFSSAPLVQDTSSAYFISDTDVPGTHTFDGTAEPGGLNSTGSIDGTFEVLEGYFPGAGASGGDIISVQYTALSADGVPEPWVAAGAVGPNGPFDSWRLDVGSNAGGTDQIANTDPVISSGFSIFDSVGVGLGSFGLTLDSSSATGVSGLGVVGIGGADIAGFDVATIQLFWEVQPVPEPASAITLLCGLVGLGLIRRR